MYIRLQMWFIDKMTGKRFMVEKRKVVDKLPRFGAVLAAAKREAKRNVTKRIGLISVKVIYQDNPPLE